MVVLALVGLVGLVAALKLPHARAPQAASQPA
jgi:hypothetical protein